MSSGSLGNSIRNGLKIDTATIAAIARMHGRRNRDAQHPHHPAVARRDGKARLHSGLIGWDSEPSSPLLRCAKRDLVILAGIAG